MSAGSEKNHLTHGTVARRYKWVIAGTFALLAVENVLEVLIPYFMGTAIDGLIDGDMSPLWMFSGMLFLLLGTGITRRIYDTRVYGRIYRETAGDTVKRELLKDAPVSQMTARTNFVSEFVEFFEYMLPAGLTSVVTLAGAIIMLAIISPLLSALTLAATLIIGLIFFLSRKHIERLNKGVNDEMERQVDVLQTKEMSKVHSHLGALVRWRIRLSDLEARNYGLSYIFALSLLVGAIYILIAVEQKSAGQAFAALTYILQFTDAVAMIPYTYQEFIRTSEISGRLRKE